MSSEDVIAALSIHREARAKGFTAGIAVACSILAKDHGLDDVAAYILKDAGITLQAARDASVDHDDLEVIERVLALVTTE